MIILGTTDVGVVDHGICPRVVGQGAAVEVMGEHRGDALVGTRPNGEGTSTRRFEPIVSKATAQAHEAQTRPEALRRMGAGGQDRFHHPGGCLPRFRGPTDEALWGPVGIVAMGLGHMGTHGGMAAFLL